MEPIKEGKLFPALGWKKRKPAGFEESSRTEKGTATSRDQSVCFGNIWAAQTAANPPHEVVVQPPSTTNTPAKGAGLQEKASSPDSGCSRVFVGLKSHFCSLQQITDHLWLG